MLRIIYFGSPEFAVPPLQALHDAGYDIAAVVSQPDRRRNRGVIQPTPVKALAQQLGLPVLTPERINSPESLQELASLHATAFIVVAYGQLLSEALLAIPPLGAFNIHGSLLPAYRGAAPIQHAILNGEQTSGVTIIRLDKGMDSGDMVSRIATEIEENMTTGELYNTLSSIGTQLMLDTLPRIEDGSAVFIPQEHNKATFAPSIKKEQEIVDWTRSALQIHNQIRAFNPIPGAYTMLNGKRLKLWESTLDPLREETGEPGQIIGVEHKDLLISCGSGVLRLATVQPEGKGRMDGASYANGYHLTKKMMFDAIKGV